MRPEPKAYNRTCLVCGKPFEVRGRGAWLKKICSQACQRQRARETYKVPKGLNFSRGLSDGVCLGCGGRTRKGHRSWGMKHTRNWHRACYIRLRALPHPVSRKLIALHREFAGWLAAWKKRQRS